MKIHSLIFPGTYFLEWLPLISSVEYSKEILSWSIIFFSDINDDLLNIVKDTFGSNDYGPKRYKVVKNPKQYPNIPLAITSFAWCILIILDKSIKPFLWLWIYLNGNAKNIVVYSNVL